MKRILRGIRERVKCTLNRVYVNKKKYCNLRAICSYVCVPNYRSAKDEKAAFALAGATFHIHLALFMATNISTKSSLVLSLEQHVSLIQKRERRQIHKRPTTTTDAIIHVTYVNRSEETYGLKMMNLCCCSCSNNARWLRLKIYCFF